MAFYNDLDAKREGWALFTCDDGRIRIQRLDDPQSCGDDFPAEPVFASDDQAIAFVRKRASEGSFPHKDAMFLHGKMESGGAYGDYHQNGAPMFAPDGTMLDEHGNRSIFDDVDK